MRFIIVERPTKSKAQRGGDAPVDEKLFAAHAKLNEEMHQAGVLVAAEGLNPTVEGARVEVRDGKRQVVDGPFIESKELIGGFYLIDVASRDEAIAWALRCPVGLCLDDVLEIRQLTGAADIPPDLMKVIETAAPTWSASLKKSG